jgi:hypothetical protein
LPLLITIAHGGATEDHGTWAHDYRKNSQEFIGENGVWLVSEIYGKNIYINTLAAKFNSETRTRRLAYEAQPENELHRKKILIFNF